MILANAHVAVNANETAATTVEIRRGKIFFLSSRPNAAPQLDLSGYLLLPGLINAHDHLEFNLFPRLGHGPYPNAAAWARDIYHPRRDPVQQHLRVPKAVRLFWGGLKNLISGVTTVAHHNPYDTSVFDNGFPVRVVKNFGWSHSLDFSPNLIENYRRAPRRWPFILHAAEGTDECARHEICRLDQSGILGARTVLVHAVAADMNLIRRRRASIVWCPSSNLFVLGQTLSTGSLRSGVPIALGTDSALTAQGDLVDEIAVARIAPAEAFEMLTERAARILRLSGGVGTIRHRGVADLIAVRDRGKTPATALAGLSPELVLVGGEVKLASPAMAARLPSSERDRLQPIEIEGRGCFRVAADVQNLYAETAAVLGPNFQLAGRRVHI